MLSPYWYYVDDTNQCYRLDFLDLTHRNFDEHEGVYIIFYREDRYIYTVYAGKGIIRDRFYAHRTDNRIQAYASKILYATWANVSLQDQDGIEAYLHQKLRPIVSDRAPTANPIPVRLPWE